MKTIKSTYTCKHTLAYSQTNNNSCQVEVVLGLFQSLQFGRSQLLKWQWKSTKPKRNGLNLNMNVIIISAFFPFVLSLSLSLSFLFCLLLLLLFGVSHLPFVFDELCYINTATQIVVKEIANECALCIVYALAITRSPIHSRLIINLIFSI